MAPSRREKELYVGHHTFFESRRLCNACVVFRVSLCVRVPRVRE